MGDLQQTDLVGPRYLRGSRGVTRFYSIHTIDVAGQTASVSQFPDKRTISLCRHLPDGFSLDPYIDARGHLSIPIAKGRVSFVRKVDAHGCIEFNGAEYFIRRKLERQYVVATLSTHHRGVFIRHEGKLVKSFPFPIPGPIIKPLL